MAAITETIRAGGKPRRCRISECYCYFYNNKKGQPKDILIMDAKTPKEATRIVSTRYGKWIKPTREKISFWIPVGG
jgi:hypothetical protein